MNNLFQENITREDLRELPLLAFDGDIHVIESDDEVEEAVELLTSERLLGFDTEKKPTFQKGEYNPTAMVQLSTLESAFLFRLNKIENYSSLFNLLEDDTIIKLGISIDDDLKELQKLEDFTPSSFTDVNDLARDIGVKHIGVKKLAAIFLSHRISKNQQTSNWENDELTAAQKKYAATDAWICLRIYEELQQRGYVG